MPVDFSREAAIVEAVLFLEGEPMELAQIVRVTGLGREAVAEALTLLRQEYQRDNHGLEVVEIGGAFSFAPKKPYWESLRERYGRKNDKRLSRAALETLSIIAYTQPVTKAEVENIRGVTADGMIKLLMERNLVETAGKKDAPGRPVQYRTTREFLRVFRLASIADLPKMDELDEERFAAYE
jgi:segregation and condensation protein B